MNISKKEKTERKSLIKTLFFDYKIRKKDIAEKLGIHRNTVRNYLKK